VTVGPDDRPDASELLPEPAADLERLLHKELRAAYSATIDGGADPEEVTADLTERLRRVRAMNAAAESAEGRDAPGERSD
jgi:hypothetical protein